MSLASQKKRMWGGQERCSVGVVREREGEREREREFICFLTRTCNFPGKRQIIALWTTGTRNTVMYDVDGAAG